MTRNPRHPGLVVGAAALLIAFAAAAAGDPSIDVSKSTIIATFKQENVPVDATFKTFNGRIDYNPAQPGAAKAALEVDTGSLDLGAPDYNAEVRKKSWFDSTAYPKATFISTAVKPGALGHFEASGTLTLKGKTLTLSVPVSVSKVGSASAYDGTFEISRAFFGIGDPEWNDVVDDKVRVRFHLVE